MTQQVHKMRVRKYKVDTTLSVDQQVYMGIAKSVVRAIYGKPKEQLK
jgi:hypothetical protein